MDAPPDEVQQMAQLLELAVPVASCADVEREQLCGHQMALVGCPASCGPSPLCRPGPGCVECGQPG